LQRLLAEGALGKVLRYESRFERWRPETQGRGESSPSRVGAASSGGEEREAVPSEPGAWPVFYVQFERALREGEPPPVDAADAVEVLGVLDAARRNATHPPRSPRMP
jgi:predicted dehydrogenase